MPTKVFTLMGGGCPFGQGCEIDSPSCRKCQWFYRTGTGTFFWCNHPIETGTGTFFWCNHPIEQKPAEIEQKTAGIARKAPEIVQEKRKRGRPPGKATKKPVKRIKNKK